MQNNWQGILLLIVGALAWFFRGKAENLQTQVDQGKEKEQLQATDTKTAELKKESDDAEAKLRDLVNNANKSFNDVTGGGDLPPSA